MLQSQNASFAMCCSPNTSPEEIASTAAKEALRIFEDAQRGEVTRYLVPETPVSPSLTKEVLGSIAESLVWNQQMSGSGSRRMFQHGDAQAHARVQETGGRAKEMVWRLYEEKYL